MKLLRFGGGMGQTNFLHVLPILALLLISQAARGESAETAAERMAERMLQAIGGRETWAAVKNTINGSQQYRVTEPTVVYAVITMDIEWLHVTRKFL
jgi:ABC-type polar amino acid transport system ATPase subunit